MAWCDVVEPCTLRECRISLGQSQAAFAATLGASPESYRTWDAGRRAPPPKVLARARALATHRDDHELFNGRNWFDRAGNFHSEALRLEERFTPITPDAIQYEVTIEDPNVFTRPWRISMPLYRRLEPNMQMLEYRCIEFAEEFLYGHLRKEPLVTRWEGETMIVDITRKIPEGDALYDWYRK